MGRGRGPGSWQVLEWGTYTDEPGSLVRDRNGTRIFTDSRIVPADGRFRGRKLRVVGLVDERTVEVAVPGSSRRAEVDVSTVRVSATPSFPRPMPAELAEKLGPAR